MDAQQLDLLLLRNAELEKELKIEAALERVRTRALAMQRSKELAEVVKVVFQTLQEVGVAASSVSINIFIEGSNDTVAYVCGQNEGELALSHFRLFYFDHPILTDRLQARKNGLDFFSKTYDAEEKNSFYKHLFDVSELKHAPEEIRTMVLEGPAYTMSLAIQKASMIVVNDFTGKPLLERQIAILKRFSRVFEQAYTRFLDLQKAEAQAREAQVEAALERVRSRSMAMHRSQELKEVIRLVLEQFVHLNINAEHAGFYIDYKAHDDMHIWLADPNIEPFYAVIPYFDTPTWNSFLEAKAKGIPLHTDLLNFEEKNKFYQSLFNLFTVPEAAKEFYLQCKGLAVSTVLLENVGLYIENFSAVPYTDEENTILMRFGNVFQQTYTRFLDLQKAEAQALRAEQDLEEIKVARKKAEDSLMKLRATQKQLIHAEKMASLGELTAGIAHEIQNPLNFVNNFADINKELVTELKQEADRGNIEEIKAIANNIEENERMISHHGRRAGAIVKGMLQHSRVGTGEKEPTDINALADEYLRLSYHGAKGKDKEFSAQLQTDYDNAIGKISAIPQDISRVLLNLFNNAFYTMQEKKRQLKTAYKPVLSVRTRQRNGNVEISVSDNGNGIPQKNIDKVFQPFFTTKPTGEGTGLGLSLSYDIVTKGHGGTLRVNTKEGEGSDFLITLPASGN